MDIEEKACLINQYVTEWFELNNQSLAKPKDLMPFLISKGLYKKDIKDGLPLRNDLRLLDKRGLLGLIECLIVDRKTKYTYWYFIRQV